MTTARHGSNGTVTLTITSKRRVVFSPMNFTWEAPGVDIGPTTWKDVAVRPALTPGVLTSNHIAKGTVDWNLKPATNFDWSTRYPGSGCPEGRPG